MTTKQLVTGGAGFIGSNLVARLLAEGHVVRVLDDFSRGRVDRLAALTGQYGDQLEFVDGSVCELQTVMDAAQGCTSIWHLAAVNGTQHFYDKPQTVLMVAVEGMVNIDKACDLECVENLYVMSSSEVYQTPLSIPTDEAEPLKIPDITNPRYSYGGGKILSELVAIHSCARKVEKMVIIRPHNVYGADMGHEHVIPELCKKAFIAHTEQDPSKREITLKGDGKQQRAFIHIDDFCDGCLAVMASEEACGIYHIGSDDVTSIGELAAEIARISGVDVNLNISPAPKGETHVRLADCRKIKKLGFAAKRSLSASLPDVVNWYLSHYRVVDDGMNK